MSNQVVILSATNITPPFSGTVCDFYGNQCQYAGSGTTFPVTFILSSQFNTAPLVQLTLTDSIGCTVTELIYCTYNSPPKQFQNLEYFFFMSGDIFQFQ